MGVKINANRLFHLGDSPRRKDQNLIHRASRDESGSVIVIAIMLLTLLAFIPVGTEIIRMTRQNVGQQLHATAQADNVARAGLTDAADWFRRQITQPVRNNNTNQLLADQAFNPQTSTDTQRADTIDSTLGLVKEYQLGQDTSLWARYEVVKQSVGGPYNPHAVHDFTDQRLYGHSTGDGLVWYLESVGYVYRRKDPSVRFDQSPNQVLGKSRVSTEIRRLGIKFPGNGATAAVIVNDAANITVNSGGVISGNTTWAIGYFADPGGAPTVSGGMIRGNAGQTVSVSTTTTLNAFDVFGLKDDEFKSMADYVISSPSELPAVFPTSAMTYINGDMTFDNTHPLRGGGVLYVNGNLTLSGTSNTVFSGLVFVRGNMSVEGPAFITGVAMVTGTLTISGANGDFAEIQYDDSILNSVQQMVGQYRENKSSFYVFSAKR